MSARRLFLVLLVTSVVVWFSGAPAMAVHDTDTFELDGNPQSSATAGDDWEEVFDGGGANFAEAFIEDWSDPADTTYLHTGGSKDDLDFDQWVRTTTDEAPDKDEIMNALAAAYMVSGDLVLYFGADRFDDEGDAQMGFWFTQDDISISGTEVNGNHQNGDVLVQSNFTNGGKIGNITVFEWVGSGGSHGPLDEVVSVDDADCADAAADDEVCAIVNTGEDVTPVWDFDNKDGSEYNSGEFYEGGINITDLGISTDCFSTFIAETRTAQPFDARLKDVAMGDFDTCATKKGTKFEDLNADGDRDDGEPVLEGWTIHLFNGDDVHRHDVTDGNGNYEFSGLEPGEYTVCETQEEGWSQSMPSSGADCSGHDHDGAPGPWGYAIDLDFGEVDAGNDFGNFRGGSKSGTKFEDLNGDGDRDAGEPGLEGWQIHLFGTDGSGDAVHEHDTTDADGNYLFDVPPGDYTVCETMKEGWSQSMPGSGDGTADCTGHDHAGTPGARGYSLTIASGEPHELNDFGNFRNGTKSGIKFEDLNADGDRDEGEPVLEGWSIHLFGTDGAGNAVHEHDTTDADGGYSFDVPPGEYTVCEEQQAGWTQSMPASGPDCSAHDHDGSPGTVGYAVSMTSAGVHEDNDFGNFQPGEKQGSKFEDLDADGIWDEGEPGIEGWTIHIFDTATGGGTVHQHAVTDGDGAYGFSVPPGEYTVCEEAQAGWTQSYPAEGADCSGHGGGVGYEITLTSGGVDEGNDFGNFRGAEKSGTKFNDQDEDGVRDDDEPGIQGWEVHIFGTDGQGNEVHQHAFTDANGDYAFDVPPGSYTVCETLPADAALTPGLDLAVIASPESGSPGDDVRYTYVVTNTGDVVLTDVVITDELLGAFATVDVLEPGDSRSFTVDETFSGSGDITRSAAARADAGWQQSFPSEGADCSSHGGGVGYAITLTSGQSEVGNDFGNFRRDVADQGSADVTVVLPRRLVKTGNDPYPFVEMGFALLGIGMILRRGSRRTVMVEG